MRYKRYVFATLAIVVAASGAWITRYEPMGSQINGVPLVWDRWEHRMCAVWAGGGFNCFDNNQK